MTTALVVLHIAAAATYTVCAILQRHAARLYRDARRITVDTDIRTAYRLGYHDGHFGRRFEPDIAVAEIELFSRQTP